MELKIIFIYTILVALSAITLSQAMPSLIAYFKRVITPIKREKNNKRPNNTQYGYWKHLEDRITALETANTKPMVKKEISEALREKVNSGSFTYHRKKAIQEVVRAEVLSYLKELKK